MFRWVVSAVLAIVFLVAFPIIIGSIQSLSEWLGKNKYLKTVVKIINASISLTLMFAIIIGLTWLIHSVIYGTK